MDYNDMYIMEQASLAARVMDNSDEDDCDCEFETVLKPVYRDGKLVAIMHCEICEYCGAEYVMDIFSNGKNESMEADLVKLGMK